MPDQNSSLKVSRPLIMLAMLAALTACGGSNDAPGPAAKAKTLATTTVVP